ncbi:hypothetical protein BOTBODRAFT_27115 [Botryobasidium botryosum FD-172 SS1]|uniref:Uncharacterized protein n=1 Tax=Botryobasidium botryosum (strain FD-172 SS1) TaxID=930990 RepID=A0A067NAF7_BOTB1|nr:hypothetical protein BOTBODRAFT_27115 [Botryobasidium botryosum FD-172 SS1]
MSSTKLHATSSRTPSPDGPPPPYHLSPPSAGSPSREYSPARGNGAHNPYGPTPLPSFHYPNPDTVSLPQTPLFVTQHGLPLPYYDPTSPHSVRLARQRARWRFWGALVWALGLYVIFGLFVGSIGWDLARTFSK